MSWMEVLGGIEGVVGVVGVVGVEGVSWVVGELRQSPPHHSKLPDRPGGSKT